ncbi:hypothetical protein GGR57DRAFT_160259 [Xylariaceae sp. FL1272]|nr:hypothetical protein GGR57DRAFT_160259 [Xylariaceae sp. FL1272]
MSLAPAELPQNEAKCIAPIPVPTHGPGGNFSVACSTIIAAKPLACIGKVLDLSGYESWNKFVTKASLAEPGRTDSVAQELKTLASRPGHAAPGAKVKFDALMSPGSSPYKVDLEVTFLETFEVDDGGSKRKGYRVAWKATGMPHLLLRSERVQEFVEVDGADGVIETRYSCWETFAGWLTYVLPRKQLEDGFERWMNSLKKVAEEST